LAGTLGPGWAVVAVVGGAVLLIAAGTGAEYVRWRRTRYRVLPERFELRRGILVRTRRSLNRDRIRSVDITAPPLLRLFSLTQVRIGTAERTGSGESALALLPITRTDAEELRTTLLHRPAGDRAVAGTGAPAGA
ncbi:PH domain-containing protein, partial [Saccharomonospora iraqiensis]|uniref:PH domain-containing protein n=1 Tax=Saccharomonospora iraqiensis TaxID=52698 RepID=UPI0018DD8CCA